jgi:hypothetical protein
MASRLEVVLRAGAARKKNQAEDKGGLTRALKRTSLVPTGACLPRNFDPDYCAYDRYYTLGVALVSTTIGAIINSSAPQRVTAAVATGLRDVLGHYCHTSSRDNWFFSDAWDYKKESKELFDRPLEYRMSTKGEARADFSKLCTALDFSLAGIASKAWRGGPGVDIRMSRTWDASWVPDDWQERGLRNLVQTLLKLVLIIAEPPIPAMYYDFDGPPPVPGTVYPAFRDVEKTPTNTAAIIAWWAVSSAAIVKYLARYMSEHALMIASFFRVNAKRLRASEPLMLDLQAFGRQCREDIADGPGPAVPPPPPPPPPPPLPAPEDRDPLLAGIDYPETYASAGAAMPFRK